MRVTTRRRTRPFFKSLSDGLIFLALLAMVVVALRQVGLLAPETGGFEAIDGDSLRKGQEEYRLNGIDAPELHQTCKDGGGHTYACGAEARAALRGLVAGKQLTCSVLDTDRYGRGVVTCRAGDLDINAEMVRLGWAIAYRQHSLAYLGQEEAARRAGLGLWQGQFETPQDWRARHRNGPQRGGMSGDEGP